MVTLSRDSSMHPSETSCLLEASIYIIYCTCPDHTLHSWANWLDSPTLLLWMYFQLGLCPLIQQLFLGERPFKIAVAQPTLVGSTWLMGTFSVGGYHIIPKATLWPFFAFGGSSSQPLNLWAIYRPVTGTRHSKFWVTRFGPLTFPRASSHLLLSPERGSPRHDSIQVVNCYLLFSRQSLYVLFEWGW